MEETKVRKFQQTVITNEIQLLAQEEEADHPLLIRLKPSLLPSIKLLSRALPKNQARYRELST